MKKYLSVIIQVIFLFFPITIYAQKQLVLSITGEYISEIINGFNNSQKEYRIIIDNQKYRNWRFAINQFRFSQERAEKGLSNQIIDIAFIDNNWIFGMAEQGWLKDISGKIKSPDNFIDGLFDAGSKDKKIYALPFSNKGLVLFYRKDLHEKFGLPLPDTLEQLKINSLKLIKNRSVEYGLTIHYSAVHLDILPFLWSNGGGIIKDGKVIVNHDENIETLKFLQSLVKKGVLPGKKEFSNLKGSYSNAKKRFMEGKSAYIITWNNRISDFEKSSIKDKFGILPVPSFKKGQKSFSVIGSWYFAVNSFSKNREGAYKFLNYFYKDYTQLKMAEKSSSFIPATKSVYLCEKLKEKNQYLKDLEPAMSNMRHRLKHKNEPRINLVFENSIKEILVNLKPVRQMLDIARNKVEFIINNEAQD